MNLLIRDTEVDGRRVDVRVRSGLVVAVSRGGTGDPGKGEVLDAAGGALLPGLVDHHVHLSALATARRSVRCDGSPAELARALSTAEPDEHGWVRGVGYPGDHLDARGLDALHSARPVRVQHRSGAMWVLNSRALAVLDRAEHPGVERAGDGTPTGRIFRADDWLRTRLPASEPPDLAPIGRELAGYGITAVTDATPDLQQVAVSAFPAVPQRVTLLGLPLDARPPEGVAVGPYKIVLADPELPGLDDVVGRIRVAHDVGRAVAVHSVTRESLVLLLAALQITGRHPDDRIEHAALVPPELVPELRGLAIVTQPGFLADRGDTYRRRIPEDEHPDLYRCRSLLTAGVPLALSSDAPYGPVDPWTVLRAATDRRTPDGTPLNPAEALTPRQALDALLTPPHAPGGRPRRIVPGAPADLLLLHTPLSEALRHPSAALVRATLIDGSPHGLG